MTLQLVRGAKDAPKNVRSKMETLLVSLPEIERWKLPSFQRPLRENAKVQALAERLKGVDGGIVPGVITLGRVDHNGALYIVDGQHRIHAFKISGLEEVIMDVRIVDFDDMIDMASTFVELQSSLVRMRPDDVLRGLEGSSPVLQRIREACPYVGYDQIRRKAESGPILSMSAVLRAWGGSMPEVPKNSVGSAMLLANLIDAEETKRLIIFLARAHSAWGRDPEYFRLWGSLNMCMCMWIWRRMVLGYNMTPQKRWTTLTADQFTQGMQALSADPKYHDWLQGRQMVDVHRNPCYREIKRLFTTRLGAQVKKVNFPGPAWSLG